MPISLSSNEIFAITGSFASHFQIFSHNRTRLATFFKEPIKQISTISSSPVYGYGESSNLTNISYIPVTGIFPVTVSIFSPQSQMLEDIKIIQSTTNIKIKVEEEAKNFIEDGRKNEKVELEGKSYNFISDDAEIQNFQGLFYYIYKLEITD
jgi:hypothetical protein